MAGSVDRTPGYWQAPAKTEIHTLYRALLETPTKAWNKEEAGSYMLLNVKGDIQIFSEMMKKSFDEHGETELYTLELHLLDHVVEDLKSLEALMC